MKSTQFIASRHYSTALIGFGPANLGLLIAAWRRGDLKELARDGIIIIEQATEPGGGSLGDYKITANSLASVFLECIDDKRLGDLFAELKDKPEVQLLRKESTSAPFLATVGKILRDMAHVVIAAVARHYDITILTSAEARDIQQDGNHYAISFGYNGEDHYVQAKSAFVNCGGIQSFSPADYAPLAGQVLSSDRLLRMPAEELQPLLNAYPHPRIAVIGSSHSAVSAIIRLSELISDRDAEIAIYGRSPLRLFFESAAAARRADYQFNDEDDVCPLSGRVNRFSGLRYASHQAAVSILREGRLGPHSPAVTVNISPSPLTSASSAPAFDIGIIATGFSAKGPPGPERNSHADGRVRDNNGRVYQGLYSFGLGSGLTPSFKIGGEKSFRGKLDGVWLYINDIGDAVLDSYIKDHSLEKVAEGFPQ